MDGATEYGVYRLKGQSWVLTQTIDSPPATIFPGNMAVGATGDPTLAKKVAEASANELLAMGVNMDLAPVVDVNTNPLNPVIGVRSFGSNVDLVSQFGTETIEGVQSSGVSAVAKHFPGHGDTDVDSHRDLPVVPHPLDRLQSLEFLPFKDQDRLAARISAARVRTTAR